VNHTFNAWVWRIIRNHVVDYIRKSKNEPINRNVNSVIQSFESNDSDINVSSVDLSTGDPNPQDVLEANNTSNIRKAFVSNLLNSMSEKERMILIHYYYDEMSYDEIAEKLEIGLSSMKVTLMRAKEKLKNRIGSIDKVSHLFAQ
jgi:RNA polymerase sigma-70 factor (ECF subfamily)